MDDVTKRTRVGVTVANLDGDGPWELHREIREGGGPVIVFELPVDANPLSYFVLDQGDLESALRLLNTADHV